MSCCDDEPRCRDCFRRWWSRAVAAVGRRLGLKRYQSPPRPPLTALESAIYMRILRGAKKPIMAARWTSEPTIPKGEGKTISFHRLPFGAQKREE